MNCQADIQKLAWAKHEAAINLLKTGFPDDAYYLAGYTIELLLKAGVCKTLKIDDFFDEKRGWIKKFKYPQAFKIHNFEQLLVLSGIYKELEIELADPTFKANWSKVCEWDEEARYLTGKTPQEVQNFLTLVKQISEWIEKRL